jgi:hypothetical protein
MSLEVLLIISLVGAFLSGLYADEKRRNVFGWAVFGFLFPVIAVIAISLVERRAPPRELS